MDTGGEGMREWKKCQLAREGREMKHRTKGIRRCRCFSVIFCIFHFSLRLLEFRCPRLHIASVDYYLDCFPNKDGWGSGLAYSTCMGVTPSGSGFEHMRGCYFHKIIHITNQPCYHILCYLKSKDQLKAIVYTCMFFNTVLLKLESEEMEVDNIPCRRVFMYVS